MIHKDANAFPVPGLQDHPEFNGLTKRELFAMAAMQGMLSNPAWEEATRYDIASEARDHADALLEALDEQ